MFAAFVAFVEVLGAALAPPDAGKGGAFGGVAATTCIEATAKINNSATAVGWGLGAKLKGGMA